MLYMEAVQRGNIQSKLLELRTRSIKRKSELSFIKNNNDVLLENDFFTMNKNNVYEQIARR